MLNSKINFLNSTLVITLAVINVPLLIARVAFAVAATILFSPLIAVVHGISRLIANESHAQMFNLVGRLNDGREQSLGSYLNQNALDIETLNITIKKVPAQGESSSVEKEHGANTYQLGFWTKARGPSASLECAGCRNGGCTDEHVPFTVEIKPEKGTKSKQATNLHALFKLNVGKVVSHIEANNDTDELNLLSI